MKINSSAANPEINHLSFIKPIKDFKEIIKNKDCFFINENTDQHYYFCSCSNNTNFLICKACAEICHKDHSPKVEILGPYQCSCGIRRHLVSESENNFFEKSKLRKNQCFYNLFLNYSVHKKLILLKNGRKICSFCAEINCANCIEKDNLSCKTKVFDNSNKNKNRRKNESENENFLNYKINVNNGINEFENMNKEKSCIISSNVTTFKNSYGLFDKISNEKPNFITNYNYNIDNNNKFIELTEKTNKIKEIEEKCDCTSHNEIDVTIKIRLEKLFFKNMHKHMLNFNFNIFCASENLKNLFINFFTQQIKENNLNFKSQLSFYSNYVNFTLVNIFIGFNKHYCTKYIHYKNIFFKSEIKPNDFLSMLSNTFAHMKLIEGKVNYENYFTKKISFAFMIFEFYIKSHFKNFNNLVNFKSTANYNIYQRYLYLHEAKDFYKFNFSNLEKDSQNLFEFFQGSNALFQAFVYSFTKILMENLEALYWILNFKNLEKIYKLINICLKPITKMLKFFIKYNLIEKDLKIQILKVIEDIMTFEDSNYMSELDFMIELLNDFNKKAKKVSGKSREAIINSLTAQEKTQLQEAKQEIDSFRNNKVYIFPLVKCVYYFILYENDELIIENVKNLKENKKLESNKYAFVNEDVKKICKTLMTSMYFFTECCYRSDNEAYSHKSKILKTDVYLKNIFEILIGNNQFYLKSFEYFFKRYNEKFDYLFSFDFKSKHEKSYKEILSSKYLKDAFAHDKNNNENITNYSQCHLDLLFSDNDKHKEIKKIINFALAEKFGEINYAFGLANRNFYYYEINYESYIFKMNSIFNEFYILIVSIYLEETGKMQSEENKINKKLNQKLQKDLEQKAIEKILLEEEDIDFKLIFEILKCSKNFQDLKYLIGYTDFFNNVNEFLDIYAKASNFKEEIGNTKIAYNNLKFFVNFLTNLSTNNCENVSLIFSIDPKNLINTFKDYKENLIFFLKSISETLIKNDFFTNYIFLSAFIKKLLKLIKIDYANEIKIDDLVMLTKIFKYFSPLLHKFNNYNSEIIDVFELILIKIHKLKKNKKVRKRIKIFFQNYEKISKSLKIKENSEDYFEKEIDDRPFEYNINNNLSQILLRNNNNNANKNNISRELLDDKIADSKIDSFTYSEINTINIDFGDNKDKNSNESFFKQDEYLDTSEKLLENKFLVKINTADNQITKINFDNRSINNNLNNLEKQKKKEFEEAIMFKAYKKFIKSYFKLVNCALEKKLDYFNYLVPKKHFLFSSSYLFLVLTKLKRLEMPIRKRLEKFLHLKNLNSAFNLTNIESKFKDFYNFKIKEKTKNKSFYSEDFKTRLDFSYQILKHQINSFFEITNLNETLNDSNNTIINENSIKKALYYLETCIINPLYKLLHLFLMEKSALIGEDYFKVFELQKLFHNLLKIIYSKTYLFFFDKSIVDNLNNFKEKEKQNNINKAEIKPNYIRNLTLKLVLISNDRDFFMLNLDKLSKLKYFQFEELISLFRKTLLIITNNDSLKKIHWKKNAYKHNIIENKYLECYKNPAKDEIFIEYYEEIQRSFEKHFLSANEKNMLKILNDYKLKLANLEGKNFAIIKSPKEGDFDDTLYLESAVFNYFMNKFFDNLTEVNKKENFPQNFIALEDPDFIENNYKVKDLEEEKKFFENKKIKDQKKTIFNENKIIENRKNENLSEQEIIDNTSEFDIQIINILKKPNDYYFSSTKKNTMNYLEVNYNFPNNENINPFIEFNNKANDEINFKQINKSNFNQEKLLTNDARKEVKLNIDQINNRKSILKQSKLIIPEDYNEGENDSRKSFLNLNIGENESSKSRKIIKAEKNHLNDSCLYCDNCKNNFLKEKQKNEEETKNNKENFSLLAKEKKECENEKQQLENSAFSYCNYFSYNYLNPQKIKLQNLWAFIMLRNLMFFESVNYQNCFDSFLKNSNPELNSFGKDSDEKLVKNKFDNFANFICKYFIFGMGNLEAQKISEVSNFADYRSYNIIYDNLISGIFFFHILCEGTVKDKQDILYQADIYVNNDFNSAANLKSSAKAHKSKNEYVIKLNENIARNKINENSFSQIKEAQEDNNDLDPGVRFSLRRMNVLKLNNDKNNKGENPKINFLANKKNALLKNVFTFNTDKSNEIVKIKLSFVNFTIGFLLNIISWIHYDDPENIDFSFLDFRSDLNLISVYQRISFVLIEMIQGCNAKNFSYFLDPKNVDESVLQNINNNSSAKKIFKKFQFLELLQKTAELLDKHVKKKERDFCAVEHTNFLIINNLINHNSIERETLKILGYFLEGRKIMIDLGIYLRKIIVKFQLGIYYEHPYFNNYAYYMDFEDIPNSYLEKLFFDNKDFSEDKFFQLASQMFFYVYVLADKFNLEHAENILKINKFSDKKDKKSKGKSIFYIKKSKKIVGIPNDEKLRSDFYDNLLKMSFMEELNSIFLNPKSKNGPENINNNNNNLNNNRKMSNKELNQIMRLKNNLNSELRSVSKRDFDTKKQSLKRMSFNLSKVNSNRRSIDFNYFDLNYNPETNRVETPNLIKENNDKEIIKEMNLNDFKSLSEKEMKEKGFFTKSEFFTLDNYISRSTRIHHYIISKKVFNKTFKIYDLFYCKEFFLKIFKQTEIMYKGNNKKIYFLQLPICNFIYRRRKLEFFKNYKRDDPNTKLKSFLESIEFFEIEINYKTKLHQNPSILNKLSSFFIDFNYEIIDFISFLLCVAIKVYLFSVLTAENFESEKENEIIYATVYGIGIFQIFLNLLFLIIFLITKFEYAILFHLNKLKLAKFSNLENCLLTNDEQYEFFTKKLSFFTKFRVYVFNSLLFNEDVFYIILNLIIGLIALSDFKNFYLYSLQLFTISNFTNTTKDFFKALQNRYDQLIAMVIFLFILMLNYSHFAFYFMREEFNERGIGHSGKDVDEKGKQITENVCEGLIRCLIYLFNEGVRAGGGIGEILEVKKWTDTYFFPRWFFDIIYFFTVILLLLNMINGVIVTAFSAVREDSEKRNNDIENRCFICSIDRSEFEKRNINFFLHVTKDHNITNYIYYIINLKNKTYYDFDYHEYEIFDKIVKRTITVFPVRKAKSLGDNYEYKESENLVSN